MAKPTKFRCALCGEKVDAKEARIHRETEDWILKAIEQCNPDWVQADGSCPQCILYYKSLPSDANALSSKKGGE